MEVLALGETSLEREKCTKKRTQSVRFLYEWDFKGRFAVDEDSGGR